MRLKSRAFRAVVIPLLAALSWSEEAQALGTLDIESRSQAIAKIATHGDIVLTLATGEKVTGTVTRIGTDSLSLRESKTRVVREIGYDQIVRAKQRRVPLWMAITAAAVFVAVLLFRKYCCGA